MTLTEVLKALYASEINVSISCFWDGGWDVAIGDEMNGWRAKTSLGSLDDAPQWLIHAAKRAFPHSVFSVSTPEPTP